LASSGITLADVFDMPPGQSSLASFLLKIPATPLDTRYSSPGFGAVGHTFNIGTFEITAGQYTEF
jgi:hypothetical protein